MQPHLMEDRPAHCRFETRAVEDRNASIQAGRLVTKDVDFAIITPPGGNLIHECVVADMPKELKQLYGRAYEAWKSGQEEPETGTSVKLWPALSPAQVKNLLAINVRTVEDLAAASEDVLQRIGMGARALQQRARAFLETANGPGKIAERLAALESKVADLEGQVRERDATIAGLQSALEARGARRREKPVAAPPEETGAPQ